MGTPRYGLIGEHLSHSFSPAIHHALCGLDYGLMPMPPAQLEEFFSRRNFDGINVTIPYKKAVIPYCDALTPTAKRIGSVNTIVHRLDGTLLGHNTDYDGFLYLLKRAKAEISDKKCLILGNGGVSPTVRVALEDLGAREIITISRSGEDNYQNLDRHADAQIIVNTTPVGMFPNNGVSPVDLSLFPHCVGVYDLIYNPACTQLILDAQRLGIPTASGLSMLVAQAAAADTMWLGREISSQVVEKLVNQMGFDTKNIILIGMPGCGKSTLGRRLAEQLGREFIDTDSLIEQRIGTPIPTYFAQYGEEAFRRVEHEVLAQVSCLSGKVIATGGGIVTRPNNHNPLRQNSTVLFLQRDLESLPTRGRPVSQSVPLTELYAQRLPLYRLLCDFEIANTQGMEHALRQMMEVLKP